jgi:hypothetical protein
VIEIPRICCVVFKYSIAPKAAVLRLKSSSPITIMFRCPTLLTKKPKSGAVIMYAIANEPYVNPIIVPEIPFPSKFDGRKGSEMP